MLIGHVSQNGIGIYLISLAILIEIKTIWCMKALENSWKLCERICIIMRNKYFNIRRILTPLNLNLIYIEMITYIIDHKFYLFLFPVWSRRRSLFAGIRSVQRRSTRPRHLRQLVPKIFPNFSWFLWPGKSIT